MKSLASETERDELLAAARAWQCQPRTPEQLAAQAAFDAQAHAAQEERAERIAAGTWSAADEDDFFDRWWWRQPTPDRVPDIEADTPLRHLRDFARSVPAGRTIWRDAPTADSHLLFSFLSRRGHRGEWRDTLIEREPEPHRWILMRDNDQRKGRVPRTIRTPEDLRAWVEAWRESHRALLSRELAVFAIPGKQVHFAIWHCDVLLDEPAREAARAWAGSGAEEPRFVPLPSPYTLPDYSDEWYNSENNEYGIYLPAPAPATSLRDRASRAATISGHPTGVKALDGILSGGYLPSDALVGIGGANGQGKTTTALELLENLTAADPEALGVYVVLDEPELPIRARRLQRHGLDREQARAALNTDAEAEIKPDLVIVPGEPDETFEDLLEQVRAEAAGRQVNMVIDSVQKLRTRASLGMGTRERVAAASQALRTAVLAGKGKLRILFTSEVARGSGDLKDSGALDYDADLILVASLNAGETAVSYRVAKNRYGTKVTLQVPVDLASQRLDPPPPPGDDVVWSRVRGALASATGDGWLSQRAVETAAGGNRGKVRACLKARTGLDVESGPAGYRLKCAQP